MGNCLSNLVSINMSEMGMGGGGVGWYADHLR